jgi:hypothetical protein
MNQPQYYLYFAKSEGAVYEVRGGFTKNKYKDLVKKGYFEEYDCMTMGKVKVYPAFATLVKAVSTYDFVMKKQR